MLEFMADGNESAPLRLFCSYANADAALWQELERHLTRLRQDGVVSEWHAGLVLPGVERSNEQQRHLDEAVVVLLLLSADFLASTECSEVLRRALERRAAPLTPGCPVVVPVVVRACDWKGPLFGGLVVLPPDGKPVASWPQRDEAWLAVVLGLWKLYVELRQRGAMPTPVQETQPMGLRTAASAGPAPGAVAPTLASLRQLLGKVILSDADLDAFCLSHSPQIRGRFTPDTNRVQKTTLLLEQAHPAEILERLRAEAPQEVALHEHLLIYQPATAMEPRASVEYTALTGAPMVLELRPGQKITLGRQAAVVFHGNGVSKRHASLTLSGEGLVICDENSKNGVYVNDIRSRSAVLRPGDRIRLGKRGPDIRVRTAPTPPGSTETDQAADIAASSKGGPGDTR